MIVKIVDREGREFAVMLYENNFNGEIEIMDRFKVENIEEDIDNVFGSNERMITLFLD